MNNNNNNNNIKLGCISTEDLINYCKVKSSR